MSLVSTTIANLVNGVSQQPYALRLASQCELQENCDASVVDGLRPRNGTRHRAKILNEPLTGAFTHMINRDQDEQYRVIIADGDIRVFDLDGDEKTVNYTGDAQDYLDSDTPALDFVALTVADYTYVLNKTVEVAQDASDVVPVRPYEAIVWVRTSAAKAKYTLTVDGFTATYTTGDASVPADQETDNIAEQLKTALATAMGGSASLYSVTRQGSTLLIKRVNNADYSIAVTDSMGDQAVNLIKGKTQRFSNLPARAFDDFKCSVEGEGTSFNTSYWVEFVADANNQYGGVWKEGAKPGEARALDATTMPHGLVRESDGTFTFKALTWTKREVGDLETNPFPSFVGKTLNDIFFNRNRFGVLADENMVMTRSGEFFNFFKESAIQVLDTDPVDVGVSHTKVSILRHAVPFNETLLLFSDQTQFILSKISEVLSPKTVALDQTTEYECSLKCKPVGSGSNIYFVQNRNDWSAVREFTVDADTQTKDAQDITAHVPKYVPSGITKLAASNTENIMVALSQDTPNKLFIYQYYLSGGEKLQSAWHAWTFPSTDTILNVDFIESNLHLIISRPDGVYLEVMPVQPGYVEDGESFSVHLDRLVDETQVEDLDYDADEDETTFTLPYTPQEGEEYVLVAWEGNDGFKLGRKVRFTQDGEDIIVTSPGNLEHFRFGRKITSRYVFSQLMVKEEAPGGGQVTVSEGRVNVRRMSLSHGASGYFKIIVTPSGRDPYTYVFTGRKVGSGASLLGDVALQSGAFRFPVMSRNTEVTIELTSEEFLPYAMLSADWEGLYVIRSRRL